MALQLIKEITYPEPENITIYFMDELKKAKINVVYVESLVQRFEIGETEQLVEIYTKTVDDVDYAIKQIIAYKPILVIVKDVNKFYDANGTHVKIRFNYIKHII